MKINKSITLINNSDMLCLVKEIVYKQNNTRINNKSNK